MSGIGPQIPPEIAAKLGIRVGGSDNSAQDDSKRSVIGPTMPPALKKDDTRDDTHRPNIGPTMPPGLKKVDTNDDTQRLNIGPTMPPELKNEDDDDEESSDDIGPSLDLAGCSTEQAQRQTLNKLDAQMERNTSETNNDGRGEWMLVPPSAKHGNQVQDAAMFDEEWTLNPEQRRAKREKDARIKKKQQQTPDVRRKKEEDEGRTEWVDEYNRTQRPKSLMQMHRESKDTKSTKGAKGTKGKREQHGEPEDEWKRQRFSRDRDLASAARPNDNKQQHVVLDAIDSLGDKYQSGSFL
ncbi:hypothetical protein LPJ77_001296 [Coemansia sp. RSA 2523]|nr:hypothetical protein LPJ62_000959 [Coemansia sp. RSA 2167]KAJ1809935.1 hypothetical protein LPJ77_001296 [Coemansia sp. RSA 2523]KAJ2154049.1 hypothetical protein J3F82_001508 [Coemansia sp. RSA 637]KAJ2191919.1 hypothetical protein GGH18_003065 [Coemansia sp. RSA 530]KAJ2536468.1 hypothetical protein IWW43_000819 [Coemansia sp. RSA 1935]